MEIKNWQKQIKNRNRRIAALNEKYWQQGCNKNGGGGVLHHSVDRKRPQSKNNKPRQRQRPKPRPRPRPNQVPRTRSGPAPFRPPVK